MVCYVCYREVAKDHDCTEAKKLIEQPVEVQTSAWIHSEATPSRESRA